MRACRLLSSALPLLFLGCAAGGGSDSDSDSDDEMTDGSGGEMTAPGDGDGDVGTTGGTGAGGTPGAGGLGSGGTATGGAATGGAGTGGTTGSTCTPGGTGFEENGDHVIDLGTCVHYQRFASTGEHHGSLPHADAIAFCDALSLAGFDDWRLPDVAELEAIVDTTVQLQPSVDPALFPGTQNGMYWTSMTTSGKVTALDFFNSGFRNDNIGPDGAQAFRCVRAPL